MSDDTTLPATNGAPALRAKTIALCGVALMTLALAALMFTLSFDALRALAIEIGVRPQRAWMAPVAIDVAQAAATLCLVVIGVAEKYTAARRYCMALATGTVMLSVAGNGYHAYQLAERNAARIAAGENLGFIPQPPVIAALIAMIFPLLWLALLHLFTIVLGVIKDERTQLRAPTVEIENRNERNVLERVDAPVTEYLGTIAASPTHMPAPAVEATPRPAPRRHVEPEPVAATTRVAERAVADAPVIEGEEHITTAIARTRNGFSQTVEGLGQFLNSSDLSEAVKRVAATRIANPGFNQVQVAQEMHLDKSTVSRHWRIFSDAAKSEGFTVPPLPQAFGAAADVQPARELQPA